MNAARLNIAIEVDDKGSVKIRQLGKTAEQAGKKAETGFKKAGRSLGDMQTRVTGALGSMKALYGVMAGAAATVAMVKVSKAAIQAASDLQEVSSKFNVVFAGQEQQAEQWSKTLVDSYAMSTRESKLYLSSVQDLLVPMGMAADKAGAMSNEVVKLSADLGSFNNQPTAQVMDDIQSALVGNYETMKKYGVVLNATNVQQKAINMGLADTAKELTAADKAQAAYKLMVEGSSAAIGDMARTSESYANQLKTFHAITEDLQARLGAGLLPEITKVVSGFNNWVKANDELIRQDLKGFGEDIGQMLKQVGEMAAWTYERMVTFSNSLAILEMVKEGQLSFWKAASMGPKEASAWLDTYKKKMQEIARQQEAFNDESALADWLDSGTDALNRFAGAADVAGLAASEAAQRTREEAGRTAKEVCEANKKQLTCAQKRALEEQKILERQVKEHRAAVKKSVDYDIKYHAEKYRDTDMFVGKVEADRRANEMIEVQNRQTVDTSVNYWTDFTNETQTILHDFVELSLKGEFGSMADFFDSALDSMLNMFIDWIAKMIANWAMSGLSELVINGTMDGFSLSGFGSGGSGGGIPSVSGSGAGMGTLGGTAAVAGGAYGMYQGGRDVSQGNYLQGGAEMAAGGYSMYQGGVALHLIDEGAATRAAQYVGQRIGFSGWGQGAQTTVNYGSSGTQTLGSYGSGTQSLGTTYSGQAPTYISSATGGYGGSMAAGQQTYLAAQGSFSGVGSSGIGSGQGMLSSYAGSSTASS
ncbi:MAG TPA: hypothetical protein ENJ30_06095, partial [Desulfobulbaceae bacterium]|nr:hypothetical protein [Desulfobulbaceae bacterium]